MQLFLVGSAVFLKNCLDGKTDSLLLGVDLSDLCSYLVANGENVLNVSYSLVGDL